MRLSQDNVGQYAETVVVQVRDRGGVLDFTPGSLETMERLLRASDELLQAPNFPTSQRNLLIFYNGCYVGETLARSLNGAWKFEENWYDSSLIFPHREGGLQIRPFHKVHRRLVEGPAGNDLVDYYEGLKERLENGGV